MHIHIIITVTLVGIMMLHNYYYTIYIYIINTNCYYYLYIIQPLLVETLGLLSPEGYRVCRVWLFIWDDHISTCELLVYCSTHYVWLQGVVNNTNAVLKATIFKSVVVSQLILACKFATLQLIAAMYIPIRVYSLPLIITSDLTPTIQHLHIARTFNSLYVTLATFNVLTFNNKICSIAAIQLHIISVYVNDIIFIVSLIFLYPVQHNN